MKPKEKRTEIKRLLHLLEDDHRSVFKRMYSHTDLNKDINYVVDDIPAKKLDWALTQCQNSYYEIFRILKNA